LWGIKIPYEKPVRLKWKEMRLLKSPWNLVPGTKSYLATVSTPKFPREMWGFLYFFLKKRAKPGFFQRIEILVGFKASSNAQWDGSQ
jgi:hypothetical protein